MHPDLKRVRVLLLLTLLNLSAVEFFQTRTAAADNGNGAFLIDGISVITGSRTSNESDAVPVLISDIEFEATLITVGRLGPSAVFHRMTAEEWRQARRQAVLLRLLAAQARYLHEQADSEDKLALQSEITAMVGGEEAVTRLLTRFGLGFQELDRFAETATLALTQLRYFEEQVELPTRRGRRDRSGKDSTTGLESIGRRYRRLVQREQADAQIEKWISDLIQNGHIRMIR